MKCVVNWIPLRIRVRWRNTQPHLNPEEMGIGEWVILFSENFEGMGMGMVNSKKLLRAIFFLESLSSRRGSLRQKMTIF